MNPHIAYLDENNIRHDVWFLDGVTALNQMRARAIVGHRHLRLVAPGLGRPLAVGGMGQAGRSRSHRQARTPCLLGRTSISKARARFCTSSPGRRRASARSSSIPTPIWSATRSFKTMPAPYTVDMYGSSPKKIAITFDDGPDPRVDAEDPRRAEGEGREGDLLPDRRRGREVSRPHQADLRRGPRDREPHLHPSRHQQRLQALLRSRAEPDGALLRGQARRKAGAVPASVLHRPGARIPPTRFARSNWHSNSATSPSATRSTPTTGATIPAVRRTRLWPMC